MPTLMNCLAHAAAEIARQLLHWKGDTVAECDAPDVDRSRSHAADIIFGEFNGVTLSHIYSQLVLGENAVNGTTNNKVRAWKNRPFLTDQELKVSSSMDQLSHSFRSISHKSSENCGPKSVQTLLQPSGNY